MTSNLQYKSVTAGLSPIDLARIVLVHPCFAYGSNMDKGQMSRRCPAARMVGPASLRGHRLFFTRDGWASVRPDSASTVWGVLWEISPVDEASLDLWEDVAHGLYTKEILPITLRKGETVDALVYVASETAEGAPEAWYLELILGAAARHGLPNEHVASLRNWR